MIALWSLISSTVVKSCNTSFHNPAVNAAPHDFLLTTGCPCYTLIAASAFGADENISQAKREYLPVAVMDDFDDCGVLVFLRISSSGVLWRPPADDGGWLFCT